MSTRRSTGRLELGMAAIGLSIGLVVMVGSWEGFDGRSPENADPRVLAEGSAGDARWAVVMVHERKSGDCLHLRQQGTTVSRSCGEWSRMGNYQVIVTPLRGTSELFAFGVLPEGTARAEVALTDWRPGRKPTGPTAPVQVRTFGGSGRYVVTPVPAGWQGADQEWSDGTTILVNAYDDGGRRLTPS